MESQASVEIDVPIDEVFDWTNNHVPEWSDVVVEDETLVETPDHVGTTFRSVTGDRGQKMVFEGVVTRWEAPFVSAVQMTGKSFDIDAAYMFEDLGGRTRVTQKSIVTGKGVFKWIFWLAGSVMSKGACEAARKEMENLKRFCEARYQNQSGE